MCTRAGVTTTTRRGRWLAVLALLWLTCPALVIFGTPARSFPQHPDRAAQIPVFKARSDLVVLTVTVTDSGRRPVPGLQASDFQIFEDDVPQPIALFGQGEVPLDIALLLDTSSSMHFRLPAAQRAARELVAALAPGDRASIVRFDDDTITLRPLGPRDDDVQSCLETMSAFGMTRLYDAIHVALASFSASVPHAAVLRRSALVVISDGDDTASRVAFEHVLQQVRQSETTIYGVLPQGGPVPRAIPPLSRIPGSVPRPDALPTIARESGGRAFLPVTNGELEGLGQTIGGELRDQYSLAYSRPDAAQDGRFHRIAVRVSRPGLTARTRAGYFAGKTP